MRPVLWVCVWGQQLLFESRSCPQLPELPRRPWRDNASFYLSDFLQPVDTGAGLCYAQKSKDLEAVPSNTVRCVSWLTHTAWTRVDLFHFNFLSTFKRTPQGDKFWPVHGDRIKKLQLPACPSLPIFPFCITRWLISGGRGAMDGGSRATAGTFSSLVSDFDYLIGKQKEVLSYHLQSVLANRSRLSTLLRTGTAAGSRSLWELTHGELAFALSERYH